MINRLSLVLTLFFSTALLKAQDYIPLEPAGQSLLRKAKIYVALAQPVGEFGDNDIFSPNSGFAHTGVGVGVDYNHEIINGFGFAVSVLGSIHGYNEKEWKKELFWFSYDTESRQIYTATAGPFFDLKVFSKTMLYCTPQIGILYANYPNIRITDYTAQYIDIKAEWEVVTGYRITVGAMHNMFDFSIHFLYGDPEYSPSYRYRRQTGDFLPEKKQVKSILFSAGLLIGGPF